MLTMTAVRYLLACSLLLAMGYTEVAQSQIFKTVDEHGNVVFTDIPPRDDEEDVEQVVIETPNSFKVEEAIPAREEWITDEPEESEAPPFSYDQLNVVSPTNDEAVRENAGNVTIVANISPRLRQGHIMRLLMDGEVVQEGAQTTFTMANVDRGTHVLTLEIIDRETNETVMISEASTFHMLRYAIRKQPRSS